MTLPTIMTPDGRRAWAFAAIVGGAMTFTVFAAVGVYLVRDHDDYAFYLALAAHVQVLIGMTAIGALLVRRMIKFGRDGFEMDDKGEAAQSVADAAQHQADEVKS